MTVEVVERRPLAEVWPGAVAAELLRGGAGTAPFYRHPLSESALEAALAERDAQPWRADPAAVSRALTDYHARFAPHPATARNLARLADPATRVVVTGQQAAPFGGPLYSLYKAIGAIDVAARLEARGIPAVPVYWLATEDDDYAEARSAWVAGRGGAVVDLGAELPHRAGQPVGGLALTPEWVAAVTAAVRQTFPGAEYGEELAALIQRLAAGRSLGECAAGWLLHLLGERGLVVLDPALPGLRALALPVIDRLLTDPLAPTRAANEMGERMEAAGFRRQLHREPDLLPFYLFRDGLRQRVRLDGEVFVAGAERLSANELRAALHADPAQMSCSVLLRPVMQDYLLNTAAFLVGPGEIAYLAQVGPTYEQLRIARPLLLPRRSATLIEPKPARTLERYGLAWSDLLGDLDAITARVARAELGGETEALFARGVGAVADAVTGLTAHAAGVDASLERTGETLLNRFRGELREFEKKVQRALKREDEVLARRLAEAQAYLAPEGGLQERRLSSAGLVGRYGEAVVGALADALAGEPVDQHLVVRLEP